MGKQPEIRPSNHVDDAAPRWKHRFYLTPGTAVALGADEQARGAAGGQARGELGHPLWRPALGVAVRRAWREADQGRRAVDAELREKGVGAGLCRRCDPDRGLNAGGQTGVRPGSDRGQTRVRPGEAQLSD